MAAQLPLSIVNAPNSYGMPSSIVLIWCGLCLVGLWIFCSAGGREVVPAMLRFGKWFRIVSCGAFGPSGTKDILTTQRVVEKICYIPFLLPFTLGRQLGLPLEWSLFLIFFLSSLAPLRRSLVYFMCTRVAPLYAFSIKHYLSKKKKYLWPLCFNNFIFSCLGFNLYHRWYLAYG